MNRVEVTPAQYERLALEMLAVHAGDAADVKDAMRMIIASAPEGADIALLLSRALAHAGDRVPLGEPSAPLIGQPGLVRARQSQSRSWAGTAAILGAGALWVWVGALTLGATDGGVRGHLIAAVSVVMVVVGLVGVALTVVWARFLRRLRPGLAGVRTRPIPQGGT